MLLKIPVVVQVRIVPTESIQSSFMLREQEWGVLSITKTILRRTKEQFNLKYQNQSREQTLVEVNIATFISIGMLLGMVIGMSITKK